MKRKIIRRASVLPRLAALMLPLSLLTSCNTVPPGLDNANLDQASPAALIDTMFENRDSLGETRALLIYRDGELIAERYGTGFSKDSKLISWSMAKSITGLLVGFMGD
jgi:CubicO group peptidase (beta-lactamase class C family)